MSEPSSEAMEAAILSRLQEYIDRHETTCMGTLGSPYTDPNLMRVRVGELRRVVVDIASARVEAERSACIKDCDSVIGKYEEGADYGAAKCIVRIVARGKVTR